MVGIAQSMACLLVGIVGLPVVMTDDPRKLWQYSHLIHGLGAPLLMGIDERESLTGGIVQPVPFAANIDPRLIGMDHLACEQLTFHVTLKPLQQVVGLIVEAYQGTHTQWHLVELIKLIRQTLIGQQLKHGAIDRHGLERVTVLGGYCLDPFW